MKYDVITANILNWCKTYDGPPFHAALLDPPYHLTSITKRFGNPNSTPAKGGVYARSSNGFMGAAWDGTDKNGRGIAFDPDTWHAIAQHIHPGGFILAFAGSRGWHRLACAMEDAGLVIHPTFFLYYAFGSGFPKATRVKDDGVELPDFDGYRYGGQTLKPAVEPIICAQRPYEGRPVDCIKTTGAGVWNIDGARIEAGKDNYQAGFGPRYGGTSMPHMGGHQTRPYIQDAINDGSPTNTSIASDLGRWPSHLLLCHAPDCRYTTNGWQCADGCAVRRLGEMSGETKSGNCNGETVNADNQIYGKAGSTLGRKLMVREGDSGTAARFFFNGHYAYETYERLNHADSVFYTSKSSTAEREAGLQGLESKTRNRVNKGGYERDPKWEPKQRKNTHPCVKPLSLCSYLATLLLPPDPYAPRRILVPFAGAGSEMIGAALAGWDEITGVELSPDYSEIARARLAWWTEQVRYGCCDPETILAAIRENSTELGEGQPVQLSLLEAAL